MEYSEIAYKIVNYILNLKAGQSVTISAEIHNVFDNNEPLAQIPFLEELALVVRKVKGLPILDISTENLHKRFFEEISDDLTNTSTELLYKWLDSADMFIDLGWRSNPLFYKSIPERSYNRLNLFNKDFKKLFELKNKKLLLLGYPTIGLAKYLDIDQLLLKKIYFTALNVNYYDVKKRCTVLDTYLKKSNKWTIVKEEHALMIELIGNSATYYGDMQNDTIITLPTGYCTQAVNTLNISGTIYCDQIYLENHVWRNVRLVFGSGRLIRVDAGTQEKSVNLLQTTLFDEMEHITLQIGLNHAIKERSLYHLFDSVKYKNISLNIETKKGQVLVLTENASVCLEKGKNILDEV